MLTPLFVLVDEHDNNIVVRGLASLESEKYAQQARFTPIGAATVSKQPKGPTSCIQTIRIVIVCPQVLFDQMILWHHLGRPGDFW